MQGRMERRKERGGEIERGKEGGRGGRKDRGKYCVKLIGNFFFNFNQGMCP